MGGRGHHCNSALSAIASVYRPSNSLGLSSTFRVRRASAEDRGHEAQRRNNPQLFGAASDTEQRVIGINERTRVAKNYAVKSGIRDDQIGTATDDNVRQFLLGGDTQSCDDRGLIARVEQKEQLGHRSKSACSLPTERSRRGALWELRRVPGGPRGTRTFVLIIGGIVPGVADQQDTILNAAYSFRASPFPKCHQGNSARGKHQGSRLRYRDRPEDQAGRRIHIRKERRVSVRNVENQGMTLCFSIPRKAVHSTAGVDCRRD